MSKDRNQGSQRLYKLGWILLFLLFWQVLVLSGQFPEALLPSPLRVIQALMQSIADGTMVQAFVYSMGLILAGLLLGASIALVLSVLSTLSPIAASFVETCISIAHPLPGIALLPLVILWIGTDTSAILFIILHSVIWPMVLNLRAGFQAVPELHLQVARGMGLSPLQATIFIGIPASMAYLLSGLEISWSRAWRSLVSAEMIFGAAGGVGGLGWIIFQSRVFMDTAGLFSALLVMIAIGILVEHVLFRFLEGRTIKRWGMSR